MKPILVCTHAVALEGITAHVVTVETHVGPGLVSFNLVGTPDASVRESRDRVRAALQSCGIDWFEHRVTINLSPAEIPKAGASFDLAIAVGLLGARRVLDPNAVADTVFMAELGLDGSLRPSRGVLPAVKCARDQGMRRAVVALDSVGEAELVPGIEVVGHAHLRELVEELGGRLSSTLLAPAGQGLNLPKSPRLSSDTPGNALAEFGSSDAIDLTDVRGQADAVQGLLIAAAGGHNLLMIGEPGSGKTMLAARLPTILPALSEEEAIEVTTIHSICGTLNASGGLITTPPIEAPHHSTTIAAMIGGGVFPKPGAVSRAHGGVLFLDEATEFQPAVLDAMRQPLESGRVTLHRANRTLHYPARFQLVMATNPCPCGHAMSRRQTCKCTSIQQRRYVNRLSGPLLDRIDLHIPMFTPSASALVDKPDFTSAQALERVTQARERSQYRWKQAAWSLNAHAPAKALRKNQPAFTEAVYTGVEDCVADGTLSLRGADRVLRLALTIADLNGQARVGLGELRQALKYRTGVEYAFA